ncbi:hypothetical protein M758_7G008700 [Ceratodon purpureus]|uniref:Uncharacterized protein n=1 Tax=Ceratodon purpureus TaxID=3225 RepID=A0A8T0H311_CERPU|nr:hypothetical protein KC19_7G009300 [Ceratodon purpureus]KAG0609714.1 hypothetical protein M758_7G008700 [Ceratodon purpureus]
MPTPLRAAPNLLQDAPPSGRSSTQEIQARRSSINRTTSSKLHAQRRNLQLCSKWSKCHHLPIASRRHPHMGSLRMPPNAPIKALLL